MARVTDKNRLLGSDCCRENIVALLPQRPSSAGRFGYRLLKVRRAAAIDLRTDIGFGIRIIPQRFCPLITSRPRIKPIGPSEVLTARTG